MREFRIHGRGGQGVVVASEILAEAALHEGLYVQAFPSFGAERRGAPVAAFVRLDEKPIYIRHEIYEPEGVIVLDESLVTLKLVDVTMGVKPGGFVLINSAQDPGQFGELSHLVVATVDASRIAVENKLGSMTSPIVNTAIVGAFARFTGLLSLQNIERAIRTKVPFKHDENVRAAMQAAEALVSTAVAGVGR